MMDLSSLSDDELDALEKQVDDELASAPKPSRLSQMNQTDLSKLSDQELDAYESEVNRLIKVEEASKQDPNYGLSKRLDDQTVAEGGRDHYAGQSLVEATAFERQMRQGRESNEDEAAIGLATGKTQNEILGEQRDYNWEEGDGGAATLPQGETNEWGGNLRNEGRKPLLRRDESGKIDRYSTTSSTYVKDDDGKYVVIPTVVNGNELSQKEAEAHYRKTGEHWGKAEDEASAQEMMQDVHNRHMADNQKAWNDYIHKNWDDISESITSDKEMQKEHARREAYFKNAPVADQEEVSVLGSAARKTVQNLSNDPILNWVKKGYRLAKDIFTEPTAMDKLERAAYDSGIDPEDIEQAIRTSNGNPVAFARTLQGMTQGKLQEQDEKRTLAQTRMQANEEGIGSKIVTGGLGMAPIIQQFMIANGAGAALGKVKEFKKGAEWAERLATAAKNSMWTIPTMGTAMSAERMTKLMEDEYSFNPDAGDEYKLTDDASGLRIKKGDPAWLAALKAIPGGYGEAAIFSLPIGEAAIGWVPETVLKGVTKAFKPATVKTISNFFDNYRRFGQFSGLRGQPTMLALMDANMIKDELFGLGVKDADYNGISEAWDRLTNTDPNKGQIGALTGEGQMDMFVSVLGLVALHGAGALAKARMDMTNNRRATDAVLRTFFDMPQEVIDNTSPDVKDFVRRILMARKVDKVTGEVGELGSKYVFTPERAEEFCKLVGKKCKSATEQGMRQMMEYALKDDGTRNWSKDIDPNVKIDVPEFRPNMTVSVDTGKRHIDWGEDSYFTLKLSDGTEIDVPCKTMTDNATGIKITRYLQSDSGDGDDGYVYRVADKYGNVSYRLGLKDAVDARNDMYRAQKIREMKRENKLKMLNDLYAKWLPGEKADVYTNTNDYEYRNGRKFGKGGDIAGYSPSEDKTTFFLDAIETPEQMIDLVLHEVGRHKGIRLALEVKDAAGNVDPAATQKNVQQFFKQLAKSDPNYANQLEHMCRTHNLTPEQLLSDPRMAEETFVHSFDRNGIPAEPTDMQKTANTIRRMIRGVFRLMPYSRSEQEALLRGAMERMSKETGGIVQYIPEHEEAEAVRREMTPREEHEARMQRKAEGAEKHYLEEEDQRERDDKIVSEELGKTAEWMDEKERVAQAKSDFEAAERDAAEGMAEGADKAQRLREAKERAQKAERMDLAKRRAKANEQEQEKRNADEWEKRQDEIRDKKELNEEADELEEELKGQRNLGPANPVQEEMDRIIHKEDSLAGMKEREDRRRMNGDNDADKIDRQKVEEELEKRIKTDEELNRIKKELEVSNDEDAIKNLQDKYEKRLNGLRKAVRQELSSGKNNVEPVEKPVEDGGAKDANLKTPNEEAPEMIGAENRTQGERAARFNGHPFKIRYTLDEYGNVNGYEAVSTVGNDKNAVIAKCTKPKPDFDTALRAMTPQLREYFGEEKFGDGYTGIDRGKIDGDVKKVEKEPAPKNEEAKSEETPKSEDVKPEDSKEEPTKSAAETMFNGRGGEFVEEIDKAEKALKEAQKKRKEREAEEQKLDELDDILGDIDIGDEIGAEEVKHENKEPERTDVKPDAVEAKEDAPTTPEDAKYKEWLAKQKDGNGKPLADTKAARKIYEGLKKDGKKTDRKTSATKDSPEKETGNREGANGKIFPPAENHKPSEKKVANAIGDFVTKDTTRVNLMLPLHTEDGKVVASDGRVLIETTRGWNKEKVGQNPNFPSYKQVFPENSKLTVKATINPKRLLEACKESSKIAKTTDTDESYVLVKFDNGEHSYFQIENIAKLAKVMDAENGVEIRTEGGSQPILFENDKTKVIVQPISSKDITIDDIYGIVISAHSGKVIKDITKDSRNRVTNTREWLDGLKKDLTRNDLSPDLRIKKEKEIAKLEKRLAAYDRIDQMELPLEMKDKLLCRNDNLYFNNKEDAGRFADKVIEKWPDDPKKFPFKTFVGYLNKKQPDAIRKLGMDLIEKWNSTIGAKPGFAKTTKQEYTDILKQLGGYDEIIETGPVGGPDGRGGVPGDDGKPGDGIPGGGVPGNGPGGTGGGLGEGAGPRTGNPVGKPNGIRDGYKGPDGGTVAGTGDGGTGKTPEGGVRGNEGSPVVKNYEAKNLHVQGLKKSPSNLEEPRGLRGTDAPDIPEKYNPNIDKKFYESGDLQEHQVQAIAQAKMIHDSTPLANGARRGILLGHRMGAGKTRMVAGIMLDNWNDGRKKALWFSVNDGLMKDIYSDLTPFGLEKELYDAGDGRINKGIGFATYNDIIKNGFVDKIAKELGPDFDGVIAFDECHKAKTESTLNKDGDPESGKTQFFVNRLQDLLPKARIVYLSATSATEVSDLGYAKRLGIWGEKDSPFKDFDEFKNNIKGKNLAGMEEVARTLKRRGQYLSCGLSTEGVEFNRVKVTTNEKIKSNYVKYNNAVRDVYSSVYDSLANLNGIGWSVPIGILHGMQQRMHNSMMSAVKLPSVIEMAKKDIAEGRTPIFSLVYTNAAGTERSVKNKLAHGEHVEMDETSFGPKQILLEFLTQKKSKRQFDIEYEDYDFPTMKFPKPTMGPKGEVIQGMPSSNPISESMRKLLIKKVEALPDDFGNPINMIMDAFGKDNVANLTGINTENFDSDYKGFKDGKKKVLVFSKKANTGYSFHTHPAYANKDSQRVMYVLQPGWRADDFDQTIGRVHRNGQVSLPRIVLTETDIPGEARFVSSVARRKGQLDSFTQGDRHQGSDLIGEEDNYEDGYMKDAIQGVVGRYLAIDRSEVDDLARRMNYISINKEGRPINKLLTIDKKTNKLIPADIKPGQFFNRMMLLDPEEQGPMFDMLMNARRQFIQNDKDDGKFDPGLQETGSVRDENLRTFDLADDMQISHINSFYKTNKVSYDDFIKRFHKTRPNGEDVTTRDITFVRNKRTGAIFAYHTDGTKKRGNMGQVGAVKRYAVNGEQERMYQSQLENRNVYEVLDEKSAKEAWNHEYDIVPEERAEDEVYARGDMLKHWNDVLGAKVPRTYFLKPEGAKGEFTGARLDLANIVKIAKRFGNEKADEAVGIVQDSMIRKMMNGEVVEFKEGWKGKSVPRGNAREIMLTGFKNPEEAASAARLINNQLNKKDPVVYADKKRVFIPEEIKLLHDVIEQFPVNIYDKNDVKVGDTGNLYFNKDEEVRTPAGTVLKRYKGIAGKEIHGAVYVHKDYAADVLPKDAWEKVRAKADKLGLDYNCVTWSKDKNTIRLDQAPDFDTAREPKVGDFWKFDYNGNLIGAKGHSDQIWHHKWQWVKPDYKGFDAKKAQEWSAEWTQKISGGGTGIGKRENWDAKLRDAGLPVDGDNTTTYVKQGHDSGGTSRPQIPAGDTWGVSNGFFKPGTRNIDIGAGKYELATNYLREHGVTNIPFDPINRSAEVNRAAVENLRGEKADTATVNNVLNVIDTPSVIENIVNQAARAIKPDGKALFTMFEKDGSGEAVDTGNGKYQRNEKTEAYIPYIKKYFGDVQRFGKVIVASKPKDMGPAFWAEDGSFDKGMMFFNKAEERRINDDPKRVEKYIRTWPAEDRKRIYRNMMNLKDTPWMKAAVKGISAREEMEQLLKNPKKQIPADSFLEGTYTDKNGLVRRNVSKDMIKALRGGEEGVFNYLSNNKHNFLGAAAKPVISVAGSMADCNPSKECAKFCYSANGRGFYPNVIAKAELSALAIRMNPRRAAEITARQFKAQPDYYAGKSLRLLDRGDLSKEWIGYVRELNNNGVRAQIFSKRPEVLREIAKNGGDKANTLMLSVDESNWKTAFNKGNESLPVAVVWKGTQDNAMLERFKNRFERGNGVVLPIMEGQRTLDKEEIKQAPQWARKHLCPIDAGWHTVGDWNCQRCDAKDSMGVGCFFKHTSKALGLDKYLKADERPLIEQQKDVIINKTKEIEDAIRRIYPGRDGTELIRAVGDLRDKILGGHDPEGPRGKHTRNGGTTEGTGNAGTVGEYPDSGFHGDSLYFNISEDAGRRIHAKGLDNAKKMLDEGKDRDTIWKTTGWWKAKDNKWRYEIPGIGEAETQKLLDFVRNSGEFYDKDTTSTSIDSYAFTLDHLEDELRANGEKLPNALKTLVAAYPRLANQRIVLDYKHPKTAEEIATMGYSSGKEIRLYKGGMSAETLNHEIQHKIQEYSGMGRGTNPTAAGGFDRYQREHGEWEARMASARAEMTDDQRKNEAPWATRESAGIKEDETKISDYNQNRIRPDGEKELEEPTSGITEQKRSFGEKYIENIQDRFHVLLNTERQRGRNRNSIYEADSPYNAMRLMYGHNEKNRVRYEKVYKEPFAKILREGGVTADQVGTYMMAKDVPARNAKVLARNGRLDGSGMTDQMASEYLTDLRNRMSEKQMSAIERAADLMWAMQREGLERRLESGRISKEMFDKWTNEEPFHVPMRTDYTEDGDGVAYSTSQWRQNDFKTAEGRQSIAASPIEFMMREYQEAMYGSNANDARKVLAHFVRMNPELGKVKRGIKKTKGWSFTHGQLEDVVDPYYHEQRVKNGDGRPNLVAFKDKGDLMMIDLNGELGNRIAAAVTGRDVSRISDNPVGAFYDKYIIKPYASTATELSPTFAGRNFLADILESSLNTIADKGIIRGGYSAVKNLVNAVRMQGTINTYNRTGQFKGKFADVLRNYVESGASIGGAANEGYSEIKAEMKRIGKTNSVVEALKIVPKMLSLYNKQFEMATRLAVFKDCIDSGYSSGEAAMRSREYSTDFNKYGNQRWMNSIWMFSGSVVGSGVRQIESIVKGKHGMQMATGLFAYGVIEAVMEHFFNSEADDDAKKKGLPSEDTMSEYNRANSLYFRDGDKFYRVPFHAGPFSAIKYAGNAFARMLMGDLKTSKALGGIGKEAKDTLVHFIGTGDAGPDMAQTFLPTIAVPFYQAKVNEDFAGRPIERRMYSDTKPYSENGRAKTGEGFKWTARTLNELSGGNQTKRGKFDFSPEMIEHAWNSLGKNASRDVSKIYDTIVDMMHGDANIEHIPYVSDVVRNVTDNTNNYYESFRKFKTIRDDTSNRKMNGAMAKRIAGLKTEIDNLRKWESGEKKIDGKWVLTGKKVPDRLAERWKSMRLKKQQQVINLMKRFD